MRRSVIGCLLLALATTVSAQHYDPYYVFPGPKGRIAADLGLFADDVSRIADASSTITAGKLSISDEWEVGLAADLGLLRAMQEHCPAYRSGPNLAWMSTWP